MKHRRKVSLEYAEPWGLQDELLKNFRLFVLEKCKFNRTHAAIVLGLSPRSVRYFIQMYREMGYNIPDCAHRGEMDPGTLDVISKWVKYRTCEHLWGEESPQ